MSEPIPPSPTVRFGAFEADPRSGELRKHGRRIKLQDQPFRILLMLLERPGDVVTREELRLKLWAGDTFVDFDHGLNNAVNRLREALGDSADAPRFIETLPRRGYRFIAPVNVERLAESEHRSIEEQPPPPAHVVHTPRTRTWAVVAAVAATILGSIGIIAVVHRIGGRELAASPRIQSLAVLPFENLAPEETQDYFVDGITDEFINAAARIPSLRVVSRTSSLYFKGAHPPLSEVARMLHVDAVIEGSVARHGDRVRITAQLVETATDRHIWGETYERPLRDVLTTPADVAGEVARQINSRLSGVEDARLARARLVDPQAYEAYLKGRYFWSQRGPDAIRTSIEYLDEAIQRDPSSALSYAALADAYELSQIDGSALPSAACPTIETAVAKAVAIDESLSAVRAGEADALQFCRWDFAAAATAYDRALAVDPNDATARQRYALVLSKLGQPADALREIARAHDLDPLSRSIAASVGWHQYMTRHYEVAANELEQTLASDPNFVNTRQFLGWTYVQERRYDEAITSFQVARRAAPSSRYIAADLAHAYAMAGNRGEALRLLSELQQGSLNGYVPAYALALVHVGLGNRAAALDALDRAVTNRENPVTRISKEPRFDPLRNEPRFQALLHRIGLKPLPPT